MGLSSDLNYGIATIILMAGVFLLRRYLDQRPASGALDNDLDISRALRGMTDKPMLWLHLPRERNAREWRTFSERTSDETNQPWLDLTVKSIVEKCSGTFYVSIIDDRSFRTLLPEWTIDVDKLADPLRSHTRALAVAQLMHRHGGLYVPASTICVKDLVGVHEEHLSQHSMYVGEFANNRHGNSRNDGAQYGDFKPDCRLMGCRAGSDEMLGLVRYLQLVNSVDFTAEADFLDRANTYCMQMHRNDKIALVSGRVIGTRTAREKAVTVHDLMCETYIEYDMGRLRAVYIPHEDVIAMPRYAWLAKLPAADVLASQVMVGKWLTYADCSA